MKNSELIRGAIESLHQAIEKTPFAMAMFGQTLSPAIYSNGLSQFWHIHHALESAIPNTTPVASFFTNEMIRTPAIHRDLESFGYQPDAFPKLDQTCSMVESIHRWALELPFALVGTLYILEGSRMGSLVIAKPLSRALGLAADSVNGVEYHLEGARGTPLRVRQLKEQMDLIENTASVESMRMGAVLFMQDFFALYESLGIGLPNPRTIHRHSQSLPLAS